MSLIQGTVLNVEEQRSVMIKDFNNPTGPKKPTNLTTFVVKKDDGTDVRCRKWGAWSNDYIAQVVTFDCSPDNKEPEVMVVKGKLSCDAVKTPTRSAPARQAPATAPLSSPSIPSAPVDREEYRAKAIEAIKKNIENAKEIAVACDLGAKVDIIALADLVGKCITAMSLDNRKRW